MAKFLSILSAFTLFISAVHGQSCAGYAFSGNSFFPSCTDLPFLNSFIHWSYNESTSSVRIAFRQPAASADRWAAWAVNPTGLGMIGAQALVAYRQSNGAMTAYTSPVTGYSTGLQQGALSFPVTDLTASFDRNEIIIFATLGLGNLGSTVNQVWQEGPLSGGVPARHSVSGPNMQSMGSLNLLSGTTVTPSGSGGGVIDDRRRQRNIHGVLNAVGWGTLIPIGAIIARYLKVFDSATPAWFYSHITCQITGYIIGVAGWATGLHLGAQSPGITFSAHRAIGIAIFCLATLQLSALLLRPKKDHKYRIYWNAYHHSVGYTIILISIINIFKGFNILNPDRAWRRAYIGVVVALALIAVILEAYTWMVVIARKKKMQGNQQKSGNEEMDSYRV